MTIRDATTGRIETTIVIGRITRGVALDETVKANLIVESPSTSQTPPHLVRKTGIATDPKRIERPEVVLESKFIITPIAVKEDLRVRVIFPLRTSGGEEVHVIRMLPHLLTVHSLELLTLNHVRIRTPVLHLLLKVC